MAEEESSSSGEKTAEAEIEAPKSEPVPAPAAKVEVVKVEAVKVVASEPAYKPPYWFLAVVSIISLGLDLGAKWWVKANLEGKIWPDNFKSIIPDHLQLVFARNKGGAGGILSTESEIIRKPFFFLISIAAVVFIFSLFRKLQPKQWALRWGLPLVLGGALGNLVDRIRYDYVVDFLDVSASWIHWLNKLIFGSDSDHWPTFNIADVAIVLGVLLMAIDMFITRKPKPNLASVTTVTTTTSTTVAPSSEPRSSLGAAPPDPQPDSSSASRSPLADSASESKL
jgi:signal peptidase II